MDLFVDTTGTIMEQVRVHEHATDLTLFNDPDTASAIMWTGSKNDAFYISAYLDKNELIQLAEAVVPVYRPLYQATWVPDEYQIDEILGGDYDCNIFYLNCICMNSTVQLNVHLHVV